MKTNREKCLNMWKFLSENAGSSKCDYQEYLVEQDRADEYSSCWACIETTTLGLNSRDNYCRHCPIEWIKGTSTSSITCGSYGSPYDAWELWNNRKDFDKEHYNIKKHQKAAEKVYLTIKTTWKE